MGVCAAIAGCGGAEFGSQSHGSGGGSGGGNGGGSTGGSSSGGSGGSSSGGASTGGKGSGGTSGGTGGIATGGVVGSGGATSISYCGGITGAQCPSDQYCDYPSGAGTDCGSGDVQGVCRDRPTLCPLPVSTTSLCGCDGKAYGNECLAYSAGTDVSSSTACHADAGGIVGAACTADSNCSQGLKCCYPCGVQGCQNVCTTPLNGACPLVP